MPKIIQRLGHFMAFFMIISHSQAQLLITNNDLHGGISDDEINTMCFDPNNSYVYVGGYFQNSFNGTVNATGGKDAFLMRHDPGGNPFFIHIGSPSDEEITTSAFDLSSGNLVVAGTFTSATLTLGNFTLTNSGNTDVFIACINSQGSYIWAGSMGGLGSDFISSIKIDASGNVYACGYFFGGSFNAGAFTLGGGGLSSSYLVKINSSMQYDWAKEIKGSGGGTAIARDLAIANNGLIWVTGEFSVGIDFVVSLLNSIGTRDGFCAVYNSTGTFQFANQYFGNVGAQVFIRGIKSTGTNEMVVVGYFSQDIFTGTGFQTSAGNMDMMMLDLNNFGVTSYAYTAGGPGDDRILGIGGDLGLILTMGYESDMSQINGNTISLPTGVSKSGFLVGSIHSPFAPPTITGYVRLADFGLFPSESVFKTTFDGTPLFVSPFAGYCTGNLGSATSHGAKDGMICDVLMYAGITENDIQSIQTAPNPVRDYLYLLAQKPTQKPLHINVYDALGMVVLKKQILSEKNRIDFRNLPPGVYLLSIEEQNNKQVHRIVKL